MKWTAEEVNMYGGSVAGICIWLASKIQQVDIWKTMQKNNIENYVYARPITSICSLERQQLQLQLQNINQLINGLVL